MTAYADLDMAIDALRTGADDFIMKPFRTEQLLISVRRTLMRGQIQRENSLLRLQLQQLQHDDGFIGASDIVQTLLDDLKQLAPSSSCVFIKGEKGAGKRLLAKTLHTQSRRQGACIFVECAALSSEAEDAELFGTEGLVVCADKGTLVLVGVEALSIAIQARLIYVLEHGSLKPSGQSPARPVDVRIVAVSSSDLFRQAGSERLHSDLLYRLNALQLAVPALRERGNDIQILADVFMQRIAAKLRMTPIELLHKDRLQLGEYHWPGNVRELHNVIERCILSGKIPTECFDTLPANDDEQWQGRGYPLSYDLDTVERSHIEAVLESVSHNKSAASRILGVSRKTLERKQALWYGASDDR